MAIAISFLGAAYDNGNSGTSIQIDNVDTSGAAAVVIAVKHEGSATTMSVAGNADSSGTWTGLTKQSAANDDVHVQFFYKLNPTGDAGDELVLTLAASRNWKGIAAWKITHTGNVELADSLQGTATSGTTINLGSLDSTAAYVAAMMIPEYGQGPHNPATYSWTEREDGAHSMWIADASGSAGSKTAGCTATNSQTWVAAAVMFQEEAAATLTANSGSYTLTGTNATLVRGRTITAAAGSYTLTGTDATLSTSATLAAASGSYTLTGTATTLRWGHSLAAAVGSYTLTGTDAALIHGFPITAASGSYTLTGTNATLRLGRVLAAAVGSYTLTGTNATLTASARTLAAASGSYVVTGQDMSVDRSMAIDSGSYTLTGTDATLSEGGAATLGAEVGSYTISGTDATLRWGQTVPGAVGSYTLTGVDATLRRGYPLAALVGSYAVTGTDAAFLRTYALAAEVGAYAIGGVDATLTDSGAPAPAPAPAPAVGGGSAPPPRPRRRYAVEIDGQTVIVAEDALEQVAEALEQVALDKARQDLRKPPPPRAKAKTQRRAERPIVLEVPKVKGAPQHIVQPLQRAVTRAYEQVMREAYEGLQLAQRLDAERRIARESEIRAWESELDDEDLVMHRLDEEREYARQLLARIEQLLQRLM